MDFEFQSIEEDNKSFEDMDYFDPNLVVGHHKVAMKPVLSMLSNMDQPVTPHLVCPNPLGSIDLAAPAMQTVVKAIANDIHGKFHNFVSYEDLEVIAPEPVRIALREVAPILTHNYLPINTVEKQGQIASAFVSPLLGFLDYELMSKKSKVHVLILGAGEGKDLRRLRQRVPGTLSAVCVEPDAKAADKLHKMYPWADLLVCTAGQALEYAVERGPYDFIISNMSAHYIFGVPSGQSVAKCMDTLLKDDGIFFGSYVDVTTIKNSGLQQTLKTGHSVTYVGESHTELCYGEKPVCGLATVSVAGMLWQDPIIDTELVYDLFEDTPLTVNVYDGHTVLFGPESGSPLYKAPEDMTRALSRPELKFYRCMIVTKIRVPVPRPYANPTGFVDCKTSGLAEQAYIYTFNKGKPLQPYESQFVHPKLCWVGDKKDGVMAKLIHKQKGLEVILGDGRSIKVKGMTTNVMEEFVLQVELIPTDSKLAPIIDVTDKFWMVVTDVLKAPWGAKGSFCSRWAWLVFVYDNYSPSVFQDGKYVRCEWPFVLQDWAPLDSPRAFEIMENAREGIVLQSLTSPPGALRQGAGGARYVKRRWTVDVMGPEGVEEHDLTTGEFIRYRPDKKTPNPPNVVKNLKTAVSYDDIRAYIFYTVVGAPGADRTRIARCLIDRVPMSEWDVADLMWVYRNRHDPYMVSLFPHITKFIDILFPPHAHRITVDPPMEELKDEFIGSRFSTAKHVDDSHDIVADDRVLEKFKAAFTSIDQNKLFIGVGDFSDTKLWDENLLSVVAKRRHLVFRKGDKDLDDVVNVADVKTIVEQTKLGEEQATELLRKTRGDIVEAIYQALGY